MAVKRFTRGVGRGARRVTSWLDIPLTTSSLDGASALINSLTAEELQKRPFTIVRTYLEVLFHSDQQAANEVQNGAIGIAVVSDQALAIGVSAVPTPITDAASDMWLIHKWMMNAFTFASAVGFEENTGRLFSIESKAMRKVNNDQDVAIVIEGHTTGEGATFTVAGRMLIKES